MDIADLPPIDLIVLSHFHGDHFDQIAERDLDKALPIVTTAEAAEKLEERGFTNLYPLETWGGTSVTKGEALLHITATPEHATAHRWSDLALPDVMGSVLDFMTSDGTGRYRVYITGDTLLIDDLKEIPHRYPDIDLALLHLGGTRVLGIMVTMDGDNGADLRGRSTSGTPSRSTTTTTTSSSRRSQTSRRRSTPPASATASSTSTTASATTSRSAPSTSNASPRPANPTTSNRIASQRQPREIPGAAFSTHHVDGLVIALPRAS